MKIKLFACLIAALPIITSAAEVTVTMNQVSEAGIGAALGKVVISESKYGLVFTPALTGVAPGLHGFHVHQYGDCSTKEKDGKMIPAFGAGGHFDPEGTNRHGTPWGDGHVGDLPALYVDASGNASQPVLAPRLKLSDLKSRALMIHVGGDNHSDHPAALGGGGARMVCGTM